MRLTLLLLSILFVKVNVTNAQLKAINKLEKISAKDFSVNSPVVEENANAVVLVDVGSTDFEGNNNGDFTLL
ncbi:MAG: hypothetical protein ACOVNY_01315, partial [Chitinophagaceae bacterium]